MYTEVSLHAFVVGVEPGRLGVRRNYSYCSDTKHA